MSIQNLQSVRAKIATELTQSEDKMYLLRKGKKFASAICRWGNSYFYTVIGKSYGYGTIGNTGYSFFDNKEAFEKEYDKTYPE